MYLYDWITFYWKILPTEWIGLYIDVWCGRPLTLSSMVSFCKKTTRKQKKYYTSLLYLYYLYPVVHNPFTEEPSGFFSCSDVMLLLCLYFISLMFFFAKKKHFYLLKTFCWFMKLMFLFVVSVGFSIHWHWLLDEPWFFSI